MEQTIGDWLRELRLEGKSDATLVGYGGELRRLAVRFPEVSAVQFTRSDLKQYLGEMQLRGALESTVQRTVFALRSFFGWVCGKKSPAKSLPIPNPKKRRQRTPEPEQLMRVLAVCDSSLRGIRDRALVYLALDTGLRCAELCRLRLCDVDLSRRRLVVQLKGGDDGEAVFSPETRAVLLEWLVARGDVAADTFFVSLGGHRRRADGQRTRSFGEPLTTDGLRAAFRTMGQRAGLERGFSPHDLRRAFATMAHRRGAPSRIVQIAGRWVDLEMVERYTQGLRVEDFDPYSPVAGLVKAGQAAPGETEVA